MTKYNCSNCKYNTDKKSNYTRHIESKSHLRKVNESADKIPTAPRVSPTLAPINKTYICTICGNKFTRASSLSRHKKSCMEGKLKDIEVENIKKEYEKFQKQAKEKEKFLKKQAKEEKEILKQQLQTYEHMLKSMTTPQTVNYFNYVVQNYPNAPALKCQKSYKNLIEAKTMSCMDVIYLYYSDNKLVSFIGNYIVKIYTHKEPKDQSIWTTDISRLTYIISESCSTATNTDGNSWGYDKKGSRIKRIIIEPALEYIRE